MNWNGGALTRSRNAITSLSTVQKGHFAKARGKLQNCRQSLYDLDFSTLSHAPTEKRRFSPQNQAQPSLSSLHKVPSPLNKQFRPSSMLLPSSPTLNDNPIDTESYVKEVKLSAEDRLEAQKRELLTMKDWCGLQSTRPPSVVFPVISDVDQIGKRRPFRKEHHGRHTGQGVKRQRSGLSLADESKKRKVQVDNLCGMGNMNNENSLSVRDGTLPEQTAEAATHNRFCSDLDQLEFAAVTPKHSSPNSNSDENLFDYDNFAHRPIKRVPFSQMSLSSQNSLPLRPSPRRNVVTAKNVICPESDRKPRSFRRPSSHNSQYLIQENFDGEFSRESPQIPSDSTFNVCPTFENFASETDCHTSGSSHDHTQPAHSLSNSESVDDVPISSVPYGHHVHVEPDYISFETEVQPTLALETDIARANTTERASPLKEKEPEVSPFGKATLSYLNTLQAQSVIPSTGRGGISNEKTNAKGKKESSPTLHDTIIAENDDSPRLEAGWRKFVLGDRHVDDSNYDDLEFISPANLEFGYQDEAFSTNVELSFCSPSIDELQQSSEMPTVIFRKPPRFSGGQIAPSGENEGNHSSSPVQKWGKLRRQSKRPITAEEDDIED